MVFQERTYSILLVSASDKFNTTMTPLLPMTDYWPVTTAKSAAEAKRRLLEEAYDIVLINAPLPDDFGLCLAMEACNKSCSVVLMFVKQEHYNDVYSEAVRCGVVTLSKPTSVQMVSQTLRILCALRERIRRAAEQQTHIEEKIEAIQLINRAKWILIERLRMSEPEAHRYIEKQAMDLRISKRKLAENIIETCK